MGIRDQLRDGSRPMDVFAAIEALREKVQQGADQGEIQKYIDSLRTTQELLEKAISTHNR
jgi:hypothetical protein